RAGGRVAGRRRRAHRPAGDRCPAALEPQRARRARRAARDRADAPGRPGRGGRRRQREERRGLGRTDSRVISWAHARPTASLIGDGFRARNRGDTISVTGLAKQRIVSDYIVWDAHVTSRAATAPAASKQLSARLLAEGVPLAADPPQYIFTRVPTLRPRLLAAATRDAQRRARVLVGASG